MARLVVVAAALLAAGCQSDGASHVISGNTQALSIVRHKAHPWAPWQMAVVVRNDPACQRRHHLKDVSNSTRIDLFSPAPGAYILRQGKRWYVVELKSCGFEQFKEEPAEPGDKVGSFRERDGGYVFEAEKKAEAEQGKAAAGG